MFDRGEFPETLYLPIGTGAVIPPWNFPNAILTGMAVAAVVTGNAVLLKPLPYQDPSRLVDWLSCALFGESRYSCACFLLLPHTRKIRFARNTAWWWRKSLSPQTSALKF